MTGVVIFNIVMVVLGAVVGTGVVPTNRLSDILAWLHSIIGITPPAPEQTKIFAIVWIATTIVLVDGFLLLLVFLTRHLM